MQVELVYQLQHSGMNYLRAEAARTCIGDVVRGWAATHGVQYSAPLQQGLVQGGQRAAA